MLIFCRKTRIIGRMSVNLCRISIDGPCEIVKIMTNLCKIPILYVETNLTPDGFARLVRVSPKKPISALFLIIFSLWKTPSAVRNAETFCYMTPAGTSTSSYPPSTSTPPAPPKTAYTTHPSKRTGRTLKTS